MSEYIENGALLGWLIDPEARQVHVYERGSPARTLNGPSSISGDPSLPGLVVELADLW